MTPHITTTQQLTYQTASLDKSINMAQTTQPCTDWYRVTLDPDTEEIVSVQYLYSTGNCSGNDGAPGSGGGGGSNSTSCDVAEQNYNAFVDVSNSFSVDNTDLSTAVYDLGSLTKAKNPVWRCLTSDFYSGLYVQSAENGVIKYVTLQDGSNQSRWEWQSLTHKGITVIGSALGGSISVLSDNATPSFSAPATNVLYAGMQLNIILQFNVMAIPDCPIINALPKSFNKSYTIQKMWDANPE